ncbi:DUF4386 domain-containing protein [Pleurocapsales cyanobacterium LEGE 10410]|nr:DUF4386 domain-containing protein [Pleurocapsales cyanobacterium LEGE 10410]
MDISHRELKTKARYAGGLYFLIAVFGFFGIMYVPSHVEVIGDVQATFNNLLEHEFLFRAGIYSHLLNTVVFTMMVLIFYQMFSNTNRYLAMLMVAFVVVHISFEFGSEVLNYTAIGIAKGHFLGSLELLQRQEWVYLFLRMANYGTVGLPIVFWGLWLIPLGILVYKSGFIPHIFGILLIAGGVAYMIDSLYFILFPGSGGIVKILLMIVYSLAEISFIFWLLIKGVGTPEPGHQI